jgi:hypothetical protein
MAILEWPTTLAMKIVPTLRGMNTTDDASAIDELAVAGRAGERWRRSLRL